jgi:hypothetical protein
LRAGEGDKAEVEFQTLLRFYPASREIWQQWYERQKSPGHTRRDRTTGLRLGVEDRAARSGSAPG